MKFWLHKNQLRKVFLLDDETSKLGEEKMRRWVDIPEYIEIDIEETNKNTQIDTKKQLILSLIDLIAIITKEQATREVSGTDWGKEMVHQLMEIRKKYKNL